MNEKRNLLLAMAIAGGLAAMGASIWCLNGHQDFKWETYQTLPVDGFNGIPAALLAGNNPIGIIFTAIFLKYINVGGSNLAANTAFNEYVSQLMIAMIVYFSGFARYISMLLSTKKKSLQEIEHKSKIARRKRNDFYLQKTLIFTIPLLIVALAGMFAERSGIINIALDGIMIFGAFIGAVVTLLLRQNVPFFVDHNQIMFVVAMLAAAAAGALFSLLLSVSAIKFKADSDNRWYSIKSSCTSYCTLLHQGISQVKDQLEMGTAVDSLGQRHDFGYVIQNKEVSGVFVVLFDKAYISTFIAITLFIILSIFLYKTKTGLRLRACGEHPQAADSVGINVYKMRYLGTTISGALGGFGGYLYIATVANGTASGAVAGMGFLAMAIMIFGNWSPLGVAFGSLMFGFLKCLSVVYNQIPFTKNLPLPMYFYNIIPYLVVLIVLGFSSGKSGRLRRKVFLTIRGHVNHKDREVATGNFFSFKAFKAFGTLEKRWILW